MAHLCAGEVSLHLKFELAAPGVLSVPEDENLKT